MHTQAARPHRRHFPIRSAILTVAVVQLVACHDSQPDPDARSMSALLQWLRHQTATMSPRRANAPAPAPALSAVATARETRPIDPGRAAAPAAARPVPPATPLGLHATVQSPSEVVLAWNPSTDPAPAAAYEVFERERAVARVAEPRYVVRDLKTAVETCYSVRALDAAGQHSPRTVMVCFAVPDTTPPTMPARLTVVAQPQNRAAVSWQASTDDVGVASYEVSRGGKVVATVGPTSFVDRDLPTLAEVCYTVVALDATGNRSLVPRPACTTIPDTRPPTVPASVAAKAPGEHQVVLTWVPSSDDVAVVRYEVARVTEAGAPPFSTTVTTSTAEVGGLDPAVRYCHAVRACDAANNCSEMSPPACATTPDLTPPSTPARVAARAASDRRVELHWERASDNVGVTAYEIDRGGKVIAHRGPDDRSFADEGLEPAREYCYRVEALDAAGNRSRPSEGACATTPDLEPPSVPGRPAAVAVSSTQLFLAWDASTDDVAVAGYEVMRGSALVARITATRAREHGLQANREYCYTVRAYDEAGNRSAFSPPFCGTTSRPADLMAPSDLRVRRVSETAVLIQWEPSEQPGVTYIVYSDGGHKIGRTGGNTYTPSGTLGAKANCYKVVAVDADGHESTATNEVCAGRTGPAPRG